MRPGEDTFDLAGLRRLQMEAVDIARRLSAGKDVQRRRHKFP
jgi:hypothetical protein